MSPEITESKHGADFDVSAGGTIIGHVIDLRPFPGKCPFHASAAKPGRPVIGLFATIEAAATAIAEAHHERAS
jgi:hypothetical protein